MIFFFDHNLSHKHAEMIRAEHKEDVRILRDHFPADAEDVTWIPQVGGWGWVLVTADKEIRRRVQEARALRMSRLTTFFLGAGFVKLTLAAKGQALVDVWPKIRSKASVCTKGSLFMVSLNGPIQELQHKH